ncbi:MAG: hypothetical protein MUP82_02805, partial [Candidatus Marinimicrobia bacterium]|nr:hypothetical protein [Candidatus Neomarinimicrobiota bacterium]
YKKPNVLGEFALSWKPPGQGAPGELYEGEMHNGLWRGMFSPTPILPLTWWWEWHLHKNEYFHFKSANAFLKIILGQDKGFLHEINVSCSKDSIEIMALESGNEIFVWMLSNNDTTIKLNSIKLAGKDSEYTAQWYNPWTGEFSQELNMKLSKGLLQFTEVEIPSGKDLALWLHPLN